MQHMYAKIMLITHVSKETNNVDPDQTAPTGYI